MDAPNTTDLTVLREQILDNVQLAFPLLYKGNSQGVEYKIVVLRIDETYKGCVFWGRCKTSFVEGESRINLRDAYEGLLQASGQILYDLWNKDKLKLPQDTDDAKYVEGEDAWYDPVPKDMFGKE